MKKIYLAGRYSAPTVIEALENIRKGQRAATKLLLVGNSVTTNVITAIMSRIKELMK